MKRFGNTSLMRAFFFISIMLLCGVPAVVLAGAALDIDGNGTVDGGTDGLLVNRYLYGFRGASLISNAVGGGCTRCTATKIEVYLKQA